MKLFVASLSAGFIFASSGTAAVLGTYDFTGSSTDVPTVANGTFGAATTVGLGNVSAPGSLILNGFTTGASDLGQYVQFTLSPDPGYTLTITGFEWNASRSSDGPKSVYLRLFEGTNPANNDPALSAVTYKQSEASKTLNFNTSASSDDGLTVRLYGFDAGSGSGTLNVDYLSVFGEFSSTPIPPVPEPTTAALALAGLALVAGKALRPR